MRFGTVIAQAAGSILRNKGRSFLTTLGIIIGIGAVIALLAIGAGVQRQIDSQIAKLGTTTLTIRSQNPHQIGFGKRRPRGPFGMGPPGGGPFRQSGSSTLTEADYAAIRAMKMIVAASPQAVSVAEIGHDKDTDDTITGGVTGIAPDYFRIQRLEVERGSLFTAGDVASAASVAVLGSEAATEIFAGSPGIDPVGQTISIDGAPYRVVAILQKADSAAFFNGPNDGVYVPYTAAQKQFSRHKFASITAIARTADDVPRATRQVTSDLLARHRIADPTQADFTIITAQQLLQTTSTITGMITGMLAGIAGISLLVGGIGIMNVMLVTVTERTREIGLRRAVGAKAGHIVVQFLTESVILTLIGGIFGILTGYALSRAAGAFTHITPAVTGPAVLLALGVSSAIGILFGLFPAIKAASLDPVEALRYE